MSLAATLIARRFLYNGRILPDPDNQLSPEQVKTFYSAIHGDLTNAAVEGGQFEANAQIWEFKRSVGTKG